MAAWEARSDGLTLRLRVTPRSGREAIGPGADGESFAVRLKAPPVDGAANAALTAFLAKTFGVPKRAVTILSGDAARMKRVAIEGDAQALAQIAASLYGAEHER